MQTLPVFGSRLVAFDRDAVGVCPSTPGTPVACHGTFEDASMFGSYLITAERGEKIGSEMFWKCEKTRWVARFLRLYRHLTGLVRDVIVAGTVERHSRQCLNNLSNLSPSGSLAGEHGTTERSRSWPLLVYQRSAPCPAAFAAGTPRSHPATGSPSEMRYTCAVRLSF
jgi:hypothetical protein